MAGEAAEIIGGSKSASSSFVGDTASSGDVIDRDLLSHLVRHAARDATTSGSSIETLLGVTQAQLAVIRLVHSYEILQAHQEPAM